MQRVYPHIFTVRRGYPSWMMLSSIIASWSKYASVHRFAVVIICYWLFGCPTAIAKIAENKSIIDGFTLIII
jgi:hypothetical protein